jgi:hypothetical protein
MTPHETVHQTGGYYTRVVKSSWKAGEGPSLAREGAAPLEACPKIVENFEELLATHRPFGVKIAFRWQTRHDSGEEREHHYARAFWVSPQTLANGDMKHYNFPELQKAVLAEVNDGIENMKLKKSNVRLERLASIEVHLAGGLELDAAYRGKPLVRGGKWAELPKHLSAKKALLNIRNDDDQCFRLCVLAHVMGEAEHEDRWPGRYVENPRARGRPADGATWTPQYKDAGLDWSAVPADRAANFEDLAAFEEANDLGIYVFVYRDRGEDTSTKAGAKRALDGRAKDERRPTFLEARRQPEKMRPTEREIKLLLFEGHYLLIKQFERLVNQQVNVVNVRHGASHVCYRCMRCFAKKKGRPTSTTTCEPCDAAAASSTARPSWPSCRSRTRRS